MTQTSISPLAATVQPRRRRGLGAAVWLSASLLVAPLHAQAAPAAAEAPPVSSALDASMFYQLLFGELEAQAGHPANAHEILLDAAQRMPDDALFDRAVELAIRARSGDKALATARAWRQAMPKSVQATRTELQVLVALGRLDALGEPLRTLLQQVPADERAPLIASLPRLLEAHPDKAAALKLAEPVLNPYLNAEGTQSATRVALGRLQLAAGHPQAALSLARRALADDPQAWSAALLALELMPKAPEAEALVRTALGRQDAPASLRLAYARSLEQRHRRLEAVDQLNAAVAQQPDLVQAWVSLGAAQLDLQRGAQAQQALDRALDALQASAPSDDTDEQRQIQLTDLICLLQAEAAELQGDDAAVNRWLARIPAERADLSVLSRQAALLARQGRLEEGRRLLRDGAAQDQPEPRRRLLAEAQLLRNAKQWQQAYDLLLAGVRRTPDDSVLIYELAMVAEQLKRYDDMESLLQQVMRLKPEDASAFNALGYSLADRNLRLDEAAPLLRRATELSPDDPFIVDSLGWLAFRQGRLDDAERLLRQAWSRQPHPEVAAHLGEVLWTRGRQDEARALWRDSYAQERSNPVLVETLSRLTGRAQP